MAIRTSVLTAFTNVPVYYYTLGDRMMIRVCVSRHVHPGVKWPGEEFT